MLQPINRLPPEIISRIPQYILQPTDTDARPIIPLTHVCRYWRGSIISTPENWTSISCCRTSLVTLSLERSQSVPLRLWLRTDLVRQNPGFCDLIMPYIQNTKSLQFHRLSAIGDIIQVLPRFPQSMPNLQSLELIHPNGPEWDPSIDPFESFPNTLRSLSLFNIPLYPSFLKLRTLTKLSLRYYKPYPPLGTLLDFLEENRSLESVNLAIPFKKDPAQVSQRRAMNMGRLQRLSTTLWDVTVARILTSSIPLRRGAHLEITFCHKDVVSASNDILSGISTAHFSNSSLPTSMEYQSSFRMIRLTGPNGSFTCTYARPKPGIPFVEFPVLPLANIRELRLAHSDSSTVFPSSFFPALETLIIECNTGISNLFSALFPNPSLFPSLRTLAFLGCIITEEFMRRLTEFASYRKNTTSARVHRILFIHEDGKFPSAMSIRALRSTVTIVDVRVDDKLPMDLT